MEIPSSVVEWVITGLVAFGAVRTAVHVHESRIAKLERDVRRLENKTFGTEG